jgi:uncharacterized protein
MPEEMTGFVLSDLKKENHANNAVIFYGGEPLLNQEFMKEFIQKTSGNELEFVSFTNGTLLDKIDPFLLEKLSILFVSIDGEHRIHDQFRGKGTFEKIIHNVFAVRNRFAGKTVARLCLVPGNSLFSSVLGVINWFDAVHWQIENSSAPIPNPEECLSIYSHDLDCLIEYWMDHLREGIVKNILPFQAIASTILCNKKHVGFRCGAGSKLVAINTSGECFSCDDLVGKKEFFLGTIQEGIDHQKLVSCGQNVFCANCEIRKICGGRCLRSWHEFPEKNGFYCSATKLLVDKVSNQIPEIRELLANNTISLEQLDNALVSFTEAIP